MFFAHALIFGNADIGNDERIPGKAVLEAVCPAIRPEKRDDQ
jgi:hypothetical protein